MKILRLLLVTGAVNGGDHYPATTTPSGCTQLAYSVVSTNGIFKRNSKSIAVTVADGKSKYGDEILRLLLWLLVLSMAIPSTILATATQFSNVGDYPIAVTLESLTIVLFQLMVF
jgi:hypothetical protein